MGSSSPSPSRVIPRPTIRSFAVITDSSESRVLTLYLDGHSYEEVGRRLDCDCKTVDNALQRVKRKVGAHLNERAIAA